MGIKTITGKEPITGQAHLPHHYKQVFCTKGDHWPEDGETKHCAT